MTSEKKQPTSSAIDELKKELSEIEREMKEIEKKYPELPELKKLKEDYLVKYQEYTNKMKEIDSIYSQKDKGNKSDKEYFYNLIALRKEEVERLEKELQDLYSKINILSNEAGKRYLDLEVKKGKVLDRYLELLEKKPELKQPSEMEAEEKKESPFGPVLIKKNLLENILKSPDWQNNFSQKNNLQILIDEKEEKIKFVYRKKYSFRGE